MNGTCQTYNRTWLLPRDGYKCRILQFAHDLFYYDFGYICMGPLALIFIISIFGRFKGSYRWFILHQVFWDFLFSNHYECSNAMASFVKPATPCFFMAKIYVKDYNYVAQLIDTFISESINYNAYSALLLLSASRFLALYFPHIYDKFTKGKNIFLTIIIFDIVALLLDICPLFALFSLDRVNKILEECVVRENLSKSMCIAKQEYVKDTWYQVLESLTRIFTIIQYAKTPLFIFLSIISTVMVILKVAKQAKFQLKHNKNDFYNSLRIVVVIALQTLINCFGFFVEAYAKFLPNLIRNYKLNIRITAINNLAGQDYSGYLDLRIADWFDGENGLASTFPRQMILQFRILIESFIVLAIMTGYRESLIDFMKFNYKFMCHPLKTFKRLKSNRNMTKISEINVF